MQLSQRELKKSELLSLLPHMIDQQVMVPLMSYEMAMAEPACTKAQYNGKPNSGLMVCRGSPNFTGSVNRTWHGSHYLRRWKSAAD